MRLDLKLQKLEIYFVATVAIVLVTGLGVTLSTPFSIDTYGVTDMSVQAPRTASKGAPAIPQESRPALLEPALRSLDGVSYHG